MGRNSNLGGSHVSATELDKTQKAPHTSRTHKDDVLYIRLDDAGRFTTDQVDRSHSLSRDNDQKS